jgi:hypothetical protein
MFQTGLEKVQLSTVQFLASIATTFGALLLSVRCNQKQDKVDNFSENMNMLLIMEIITCSWIRGKLSDIH